ncbi:MaoC/PaaZ C-terminal domain-containing protein [Mycobacterium branderi]|uniref:3-hydroxyacyl-thioester dehydratase HtdY n=1 Tax=Mycobacterium branderi TaxID=43348 RepID=A0A7I7WG89_9MYCO|nr:MaoC/PaaZ C-terminal domain-containing protein [Mycobacterium branderi]MCV7231851.1 MaoC family dehydratase N-terminal domain-containing protein [Mycobacterium branderi]ORA40204.1 enoyl-CoA hydratase [Mycobacterium branderi]BBZ15493.1 3-hydroxyacyl-thioester dehydratase HtdY [Mycobacterium branderi]
MPLNPDAVGYTAKPYEAAWDSKDCLLYALGVGAGSLDPTGFELEYTTENSEAIDQRVLPTFPVVVPRGAKEALTAIGDFNMAMLVHGEQSVELHTTIPVAGSVSSTTTVTGIYDKGSGAVVTTSTVATEISTGTALWTLTNAMFIRGEGGFGGDRGPSGRTELPQRDPDHCVIYRTRPDQALLYRLSGDRNPLHADPRFAARAGFDKPILHGLCTFGFTGRALLHSVCQSDPDRFVRMAGRFSKPVFPGEDLTVRVWITGAGNAVFQTSTPAAVVIDAGQFRFR